MRGQSIKDALMEEGALFAGVTGAEPINAMRSFNDARAKGFFGGMEWLDRTAPLRCDPTLHLRSARSIICSAWAYEENFRSGVVARFARGRDYHASAHEKMERAWQRAIGGRSAEGLFFVDSKPIMEKAFTARAGLGWIGKNSLLINREHGSFFSLGLILTDAEFDRDGPAANECGDCTKCIDACPTKAIVSAGVVDCRRCVSYLTIEHRGEIPAELRGKTGTRVFGCDACQDACPYNPPAPSFSEEDIRMELEGLLRLDEKGFKERFCSTPAYRIGYERFIRNVKAALHNLL